MKEKMPMNRLMYYGFLVIAAAVLLWLATTILTWLMKSYLWIGLGGVAMVIVGAMMEFRRKGKEEAAIDAVQEVEIVIPDPDKVS
jgi:uncharacterized membrane-anchored protein